MNDPTLISNEEINHDIPKYMAIYKKHGAITFELSRFQYDALATLTREYQAGRKNPEFEMETWANQCGDQGLFKDEKATMVFGFVIMFWSSDTQINVEKSDFGILFHVINRPATQ